MRSSEFNPKVLLLDGNAFIHRCYHTPVYKGLTNDDGLPSGAIVGVYEKLKGLKDKYPEARIITVFDFEGDNFRHRIYPEYKACRSETDLDLYMQFDKIHEMCKLMGLEFQCVPDVEADDVIASLSRMYSEGDVDHIICSGDKDLMQLVDDNTKQLTMVGELMDFEAVEHKFGVRPDQLLDFLALQGDKADNIPGVPKVGAKTAARYLAEYDTLEKLIEARDDLSGAPGQSFRDNLDAARLSKRLATLKTDVRLTVCSSFSGLPLKELEAFKEEWNLESWCTETSEFDVSEDEGFVGFPSLEDTNCPF